MACYTSICARMRSEEAGARSDEPEGRIHMEVELGRMQEAQQVMHHEKRPITSA